MINLKEKLKMGKKSCLRKTSVVTDYKKLTFIRVKIWENQKLFNIQITEKTIYHVQLFWISKHDYY